MKKNASFWAQVMMVILVSILTLSVPGVSVYAEEESSSSKASQYLDKLKEQKDKAIKVGKEKAPKVAKKAKKGAQKAAEKTKTAVQKASQAVGEFRQQEEEKFWDNFAEQTGAELSTSQDSATTTPEESDRPTPAQSPKAIPAEEKDLTTTSIQDEDTYLTKPKTPEISQPSKIAETNEGLMQELRYENRSLSRQIKRLESSIDLLMFCSGAILITGGVFLMRLSKRQKDSK